MDKFLSHDLTREEYLGRLARASSVKDDRLRRVSQENITDHLTGKPNSRAVEILFEHLRKTGRSEAVFLLDVDNMKAGNTSIGHRETNKAITQIVEVSDVVIEEVDGNPIEMIILRRGEEVPTQGLMRMHNRGDEFLIFTYGLTTLEQRQSFAESLRQNYFYSPPIQELNTRT